MTVPAAGAGPPTRRAIEMFGDFAWRPYRRYRKPQLPMWHRHRVGLYPHVGQLSGIRDKYGHELVFPAAFRLSRAGQPQGIIKIGGTS